MKTLGVRLRETSGPVDLLSAQVERGFAFVPEGACEKVLLEKKKALPDGGEEDIDRKTTLTLACIAAIKPALSAEDASAAVNKAFLAENPDCYATLQVDADTLGDVVDKGEAKKMAEYTVQVQKASAKKALVMQTREKLVGKYFRRSSQPKWSAEQKKAVPMVARSGQSNHLGNHCLDNEALPSRRGHPVRRLHWSVESDCPDLGVEIHILDETRLRKGIHGSHPSSLDVPIRLEWLGVTLQPGSACPEIPRLRRGRKESAALSQLTTRNFCGVIPVFCSRRIYS